MISAFETMRYKLGWATCSTSDIAQRRFTLNEGPSRSQPDNEDIALETLIEPKLLITTGQLLQAFLHVGGEFAHRDHAVTIGIDLVGRGHEP